jgi:hypothetical protein
MEISDIERIAKETHVHFVDTMWERFGWTSHPGYCKVIARPFLIHGALTVPLPDQTHIIYISTSFTYNKETTVVDTTCHESAHYLHIFGRKEVERRGVDNIPSRNIHLDEIVANLGSVIYLNDLFGQERARKFGGEEPSYTTLVAYDIFEGDKSLLTKIANLDMVKAKKLILPHLKRPLYDRSYANVKSRKSSPFAQH